jgi:hypothetical protein
MQGRPFFLQEQTLDEQAFFDKGLQLQQMNFKSHSGAHSMSVIIGRK